VEPWGLLGDPFAARAAEVAAAGYSTRVIGGEDERTVWGRATEDGWQQVRADPESGGDAFGDWIGAKDVQEVTIDGAAWMRLGDLAAPRIAVSAELLPQVQAAAVWNPTYGYVLPSWRFSEMQHASYTGSVGFGGSPFSDPRAWLDPATQVQRVADVWSESDNFRLFAISAATMGAAAALAPAAVAAEGSAIVGAGELVAVEAPAALSSGAPMFSAEALAADAFVFAPEAALTPAAGEFGGPLMFSAEHAAAGAFGGEFFAAPAVVELGGASMLSQAADLAAKAKTAVSPLLAAGRALRSALGADAPGGTAYGEGGDSFASDLLWTVAPLALLFFLKR